MISKGAPVLTYLEVGFEFNHESLNKISTQSINEFHDTLTSISGFNIKIENIDCDQEKKNRSQICC